MASDSDIVTLQNIDDEDFMFEYNSSEGNPPYLITAGEVARFPRFLAKHALKHLIDKILNKRDEITGNETLRLELANQIIIGEESIHQKAQPTEDERLRLEIEELNKPSTLDAILAKRKKEKSYKKEVAKAEKKDMEIGERFEGLDDIEPEAKEEPTPEPEPTPKPIKTKPVKAKPTRAELYRFAKDEVKMTIDDKTKKKFDKMKVDDLMKELQYSAEK